MTPQRAKELLPIIQAYAEGKEIQCRISTKHEWVPARNPGWFDCYEYRIKPEKKKGWINIYHKPVGVDHQYFSGIGGPYDSHLIAKTYRGRNCVACIEIEYEEGEGL